MIGAALASFGVRTELMFLCAVNCCWNSLSATDGVQVPAGSPTLTYWPLEKSGVEHPEVPLREQGGVVVGRVALHHQHVRLADVPVLDAGGEALADLLADHDVVEADVVLAAAAEGQPVVVDDGHAVRLGVGLDLRPDPGVQRVHDQHGGALGDGGLRVG